MSGTYSLEFRNGKSDKPDASHHHCKGFATVKSDSILFAESNYSGKSTGMIDTIMANKCGTIMDTEAESGTWAKKKAKLAPSKLKRLESAEPRLERSAVTSVLYLPEDKVEISSKPNKANKRKLENLRNDRLSRNTRKAVMEKNRKRRRFHCIASKCDSNNITHQHKSKCDAPAESRDDSIKAKEAKESARKFAHGTSWRRIFNLQGPTNIFRVHQAFCNLVEQPLSYFADISRTMESAAAPSFKKNNETLHSQSTLSGTECGDTIRAFVSSMTSKLQEGRKKKAFSIVNANRKNTRIYLSRVQSKQLAHMANLTSPLHPRGIKVKNVEFEIVSHQGARELENKLGVRSKSANRNIKYNSFLEEQGTSEKIVPASLIELICIPPFCNSTVWVGLKANFREEDDPVLRYLPYFGDHDPGDAIDVAQYQSVRSNSINTISSIDDEVHGFLFQTMVQKWGSSSIVLNLLEKQFGWTDTKTKVHALQEWSSIPSKTVKEGTVPNNRTYPKNGFLGGNRDNNHTMLSRRLAASRPSTYIYNHIGSPMKNTMLHGTKVTAERSESFRDLFCRMCYKYDCSVHGIQHPLPSKRNDPYYPKTRLSHDIENDGLSSSVGDLAKEHTGRKLRSSKSCRLRNEEVGLFKRAECISSAVARRSYRTHTRVNTLATNHLLQQELCQSGKTHLATSSEARKQEFELQHSEYVDFPCLSIFRQDYNMMTCDEDCGPFCFRKIERSQIKYRKLFNHDHFQSASICTPTQHLLLDKIRSVFGDNPCIVARILRSMRCNQVSTFFESDKRKQKKTQLDEGSTLSITRYKSRGKRRYNHRVAVGFHRDSLLRGRTLRTEQELEYEPCEHSGLCTVENCSCLNRGHTCEKACSCSKDCPNRFQGCRCSFGNCRTKACPCFAAARECLPDLCFTCGATEVPILVMPGQKQTKRASPGKNTCSNVNLQLGVGKKIGVGFSNTHGWGAFALEPIWRGEFICEYIGAMISQEEAERRGSVYDKITMSFLFNLNEDAVIDAVRRGNKSKFINHGNVGQNCTAKVLRVGGEHHIAIFAREDIAVGKELYFNYGYQGQSAPDWS